MTNKVVLSLHYTMGVPFDRFGLFPKPASNACNAFANLMATFWRRRGDMWGSGTGSTTYVLQDL